VSLLVFCRALLQLAQADGSSAITYIDPAGKRRIYASFQRHVVDVQGTLDKVAQAGVRAITRLFYSLAGVVTLNATKNQLSQKIEFMLANGSGDYAYEIVWHLPAIAR
jgi:hypothetical protein